MKLYKTSSGYTLVNHEQFIFDIVMDNNRILMVNKCGKAGKGYMVSGRLLRNIPNNIKNRCFKLNKKI